jgi:DNA invertase Pin-like site-specific DNA recombinase
VPHSQRVSDKEQREANNRVVGYIRVSTDMQATEGVSLEAQREKIRAYCTALDLTLVDILEDQGLSAKSLERPALKSALGLLRSGQADILLVTKLDRLTRSVKDLGQLVDSYFLPGRYSLLSISDSIDTRTASGRLVLNVLASVAQWEREAISERTSEALRHLIAQGVYVGTPPFGMVRTNQTDEHGRRIVVVDAERRQVVERMVAMDKAGKPLRDIAEALNAEGIPSPRGGAWHPTVVRGILRREAGLPAGPARPREVRIRTREMAATRALALREREYSLRKIARILYKEGFRAPRGGHWHASAIAELLRMSERE